MRVKDGVVDFFRQQILKQFPHSELYLFGSRADDNARGGDLDLLILSEEKIESSQLRKIKCEFYKAFGWQKVDLVFIRDLRNQIAHEYIPEALNDLVSEVLRMTEVLSENINATAKIMKSREWIK